MSKLVFIDTDVLIDVYAMRHPFYESSANFLSLAESNRFKAYTSPLIIANTYYVLQKFGGKDLAKSVIRKTRAFISIVDITEKIIDKAINSSFSDFEDAIEAYSAENFNLDLIVTRNLVDYKNAGISVMSPLEAIALFGK